VGSLVKLVRGCSAGFLVLDTHRCALVVVEPWPLTAPFVRILLRMSSLVRVKIFSLFEDCIQLLLEGLLSRQKDTVADMRPWRGVEDRIELLRDDFLSRHKHFIADVKSRSAASIASQTQQETCQHPGT